MIKILWDWNGTLLDDLELSLACMQQVQKENGILPLPDLDTYRKVFGFPVKTYYEKAGFDFEKQDWSTVGARFMDLYVSHFSKTALRPDAAAALLQARDLGIASYILSASRIDLLKTQIQRFPELKDCFAGVYGIGDIYASSKVGAGEEFMETCLDWNEVWMVGDTLHDQQVAQKIGAKFLALSGGHQRASVFGQQKVCESLMDCVEEIYGRSTH